MHDIAPPYVVEVRPNVFAYVQPDGTWWINTYDDAFTQPEWGSLEMSAPTITFETRLDLWADDTLVELHAIGYPAHTTNDVVAWLPEHKVLFTGDLVFNQGTPFVVMGSVPGSIVSIERLRSSQPRASSRWRGYRANWLISDGPLLLAGWKEFIALDPYFDCEEVLSDRGERRIQGGPVQVVWITGNAFIARGDWLTRPSYGRTARRTEEAVATVDRDAPLGIRRWPPYDGPIVRPGPVLID